MLTFDINELALEEMRAEDGSLAYKLDLPVYAAKGSRDTSVVYFEIETGASLGMHTDSSEEVVLILQGTGEGVVGGKTAHLPQGRAVVVPGDGAAPHHKHRRRMAGFVGARLGSSAALSVAIAAAVMILMSTGLLRYQVRSTHEIRRVEPLFREPLLAL